MLSQGLKNTNKFSFFQGTEASSKTLLHPTVLAGGSSMLMHYDPENVSENRYVTSAGPFKTLVAKYCQLDYLVLLNS